MTVQQQECHQPPPHCDTIPLRERGRHDPKWKCSRSGRSPTWRCRTDSCSLEISVRKGTCFDGPRRRTSLQTAVLFMYDWCRQVNSIQHCERELGMGRNAAVTWNHWMRKVAVEVGSVETIVIDREVLTVELDETLL
uniref:Uncharacterized protein n=1 Tax=Trichuris muris TaxID=70415 RepID=A0A5S6Q4C7_TRIMR